MHHLFLSIIDSSKYIYYFGTTDKDMFVSCLLFGYFGVFLGILIDVGKRNPQTIYSPVKFSWSFFFKDNVVKFIVELLLVAVFIRFSANLLGQTTTQFVSIMVGLGADRLAQEVRTKRDAMLPWGDNSSMQTTSVTASVTTVTNDTNQTAPVAEVPPIPPTQESAQETPTINP